MFLTSINIADVNPRQTDTLRLLGLKFSVAMKWKYIETTAAKKYIYLCQPFDHTMNIVVTYC